MNSDRKAFIFIGKGKEYQSDNLNNLSYLDNDAKAIKQALDADWSVADPIRLDNPSDITNTLRRCQAQTILLYYTGHGVVIDQVFKLVGHIDEAINLLDNLANIKGHLRNKKLAIILDACHSGIVIDNLPNTKDFEILTATDSGKAYDEVAKKKGFFTHYFCEYLENNRHKINCLDEIGFYIERRVNTNYLKTQNPQYHFHNTLDNVDKIIITESIMLKDTKEALKTKYPNPIDFKNAILQYITSSNGENFTNIKKANSYDDLFGILMKEGNENIVCCLSKDLAVKYPCPSQYNNCEELKKRAKTSRSVKSVILKIEPVNSGKIDKCKIDGWIDRDDGIYEIIEFSEIIDFEDDSYRTKFPKCLANILGSRELSESCELKLLLANPLFKKNLYDLEITLLDGFDDPDKLSNVFNIAAKILFRTNFKPSSKWIKSSARYKKKGEETISKYAYSGNACSDFSIDCSNFNNGCADSGQRIHYISMVSNSTILDEKDLKKIIRHGIPIVICPENLNENNIVIDWQETLVKNMEVTTFNYIRNHTGNMHFIHDTYDESIKLQVRSINETDNKTQKDNFLEG